MKCMTVDTFHTYYVCCDASLPSPSSLNRSALCENIKCHLKLPVPNNFLYQQNVFEIFIYPNSFFSVASSPLGLLPGF